MTASPKWLPRSWRPRVRRHRRACPTAVFRPVGETARQRVQRWALESDERLAEQARALGLLTRGRSRKWHAERVKENEWWLDEAVRAEGQ